MRKIVAVLLWAALVAAAVWLAVRTFPRVNDAPGARVSKSSTKGDASAGLPLPPLGDVCGGRCGTERWRVKTLSDVDREYVRLEPVDATVEELIEVQPEDLAPGGMRYMPTELTVYRVEGYLGGAFGENDGDWHLVLYGLHNQRASLIAEIPDPSCEGACQSGFAQDFARARQAVQERLERPNPKDEPIRVRMTGVGFFDRAHGQTGAAPNNFELHPVLTIEFPN